MSFNNIEQALQAFLQSNTESQKSAEEFLNNLPKQNFDEGITQFLNGMALPDQNLAQLSALYLKKKYLDDDSILVKMSEQHVTTIITKVQESVNGERSYGYLQRSFEILVKLYSYAKKEEMIMDLVKTLANQNADAKIKRALMYMIEITCEYSFTDELLIKYSQDLAAIFQNYLEDSDLEVRVSAFKSLTVFLASIKNEELVKQFASVFPLLLSKTIEALKEDGRSGQKNLQSLVELCEVHPKFIKPIFEDLVNLFTEIISNKQFEETIRVTAFSGITVLCTTGSALVRKSQTFKTKTIQSIMMVMTEIEFMDLSEWNKELNEELLSQQHPSLMAVESLGKIGPEIGVKYLLPLFIPLIKEAIASPQWQNQHAGLMGISMLSEGCKEVYATELDNIFQMVSSLGNSSDPRIIAALLKTYGLLAEEFNPEFVTKYGQQVIPFITTHLASENIKIQYTSVQAMVSIARSLQDSEEESSVLSQYSQQILSPITNLFQKCVDQKLNTVLEEVLSCLSIVSYVLESDFAQYYNIYMPGLQSLIESIPASNQEQINLRMLILECMGYILASVKKDAGLFVPEAMRLMEVLIKMQNMYAADDAHHSSIYVVMGQIADGLGEKFSQFIPQIFDKVLNSMEQENIAKLNSGDSAQQEEKNVLQKNLDLGMFGNFNFQLNTVLLEQKIEGAHLIFSMAKSVGKAFFPYVEKTLAIVTKNFSFSQSQDFRQTCIKTLQYLILACETDQQMAIIVNNSLPLLLKELDGTLKLQKDDQISFVLEQIGECLKMFQSPLVQQNLIEELLTKTSKSLEVGEKLKKQIKKEYEDEDMDEEMTERMEDELDEVNAIMRASIEILGFVLKVYNTAVEGLVINSIMPHFFTIVQQKDSLENEVFNALFVFDTLMEHCSQEIYQKAYGNIQQIFENIHKTEIYNTPDILQNLISGYAIFAKRTEASLFNQSLNSMIKVIQSVLEDPKAQDEEHVVCTESAIAAVGKFALFQLKDNAEIRGQMVNKFLSSLPLKHDSDEAQSTHLILLQEILNKNSALFENQQVQDQLKTAIQNIQTLSQSNPESEILCDQGKQLIVQVLQN